MTPEKQEVKQASTENQCHLYLSLSHLCGRENTHVAMVSRHDPPVTDVASKHLGEAVAPEEAAQHHAGLPLAPAELLCHADSADGHRHTGAVEEACPEEQHHCPYPRHWPAQEEGGLTY